VFAVDEVLEYRGLFVFLINEPHDEKYLKMESVIVIFPPRELKFTLTISQRPNE
jgi:hypothetical protein